MKKIIVSIILLLILVFSCINHAGASSHGREYLWTLNVGEDLKDENFTGVARGIKMVGLYMEFSGMRENLRNYSFSGMFYSNTYLNGKLDMVELSQQMIWKNALVERWINYEGHFLLERYNTTHNGITQSFYGIKKVIIHIYTKQPEKVQGETISTLPLVGRIIQRNYYSLKYDLHLEINYSKPVPYMPMDGKENISYYTNANFYGKLSSTSKGYSKINNITTDLNKTVDEKISGIVHMRVQMNAHGNVINRTGIIELLPLEIGMRGVGILYHPNEALEDAIMFGTMRQDTVIIDNSSYEKITLPRYVFGMKAYTSKSVSRDVIKRLMENGPENGNLSTFKIYISTGVSVFISVLVLAYAFKARRGQMGTT